MKDFEQRLRAKVKEESKKGFERGYVDDLISAKLREEGASSLIPLLVKAYEALRLVEKFGYGVNVERTMAIKNTASVVKEAKAQIEGWLGCAKTKKLQKTLS